MNHRDDLWPTGVQEYALAEQKHDISLLTSHLPMGPPSVMYKLPNMAWQPKRYLRRFLPLCADASLSILRARPVLI